RAAPARQKRAMQIEAAEPWRIENGLGKNEPVGDDDRRIEPERSEGVLRLRASEALRRAHLKAARGCERMHRRRPLLLAAPRRARRLGVDAGDFVAGLDQR